jgi:hypothetical protein
VATADFNNDGSPDLATGNFSSSDISVLRNRDRVAASLAIDVPASVTVGQEVPVTVTARDRSGAVVTGFRGTVHFTSNDPAAVLPTDYTFTAADAGTHAFTAIFATPGTATLGVFNRFIPTLRGSAALTVIAAVPDHFQVAAPPVVNVNEPFPFTVSARDSYDHLVTGYRGTVHLTSSDGTVLPPDYTFTDSDGGQHTFTARLPTVGTVTLTATDTDAGFSGNTTVLVAEPAVSLRLVDVPDTVTAGQPFAITVQAVDESGNPAPGYRGTVTVTSDDPQGNSVSHTFVVEDSGTSVFTGLVLKTAGAVTLLAGDGTLSGSASVLVDPGQASQFVLSAPNSTTAGASFSLSMTASDDYGNVVTDYTGDVTLTSDDPLAATLGSYTFTVADAGRHTFTGLVLKTAGVITLSASDGVVTGSASVVVDPGAATLFLVQGPDVVRSGGLFSLTVSVLDTWGNVVTGYTGTVHFTSSDGSAVLPSDYTFGAADGGVHTFEGLQLFSLGHQQVTVTDDADATLFGTRELNVLTD